MGSTHQRLAEYSVPTTAKPSSLISDLTQRSVPSTAGLPEITSAFMSIRSVRRVHRVLSLTSGSISETACLVQ